MNLEQGEHILMVQVQNKEEITSTIERLSFNVIVQSKSGNLHFTDCMKVPNFMERVFSEAAMREGESKEFSNASSLNTNCYKMSMYEYFSKNENVYVQVYANKDPDNIWIQKLRPTMNNFEVIGQKNQKRPVELRIDPNTEKSVIFQQVNAESFHFSGGKGDFMIEKVKR